MAVTREDLTVNLTTRRLNLRLLAAVLALSVLVASCTAAPPPGSGAADTPAAAATDPMAAKTATPEMMNPTATAETMASPTAEAMADATATPDTMAGTSELTLEFSGLADLGPGAAYEGWLIVADEPVSTGVFTVDGSGRLSQTAFAVPQEALEAAGAFVLTVEPAPDPDPAPSAVHLVAGDFSGNTAELSVTHMAALGDDFSGSTGQYVLAAPTDPSASYAQGIWWENPFPSPGPSLVLPALPEGWIYEGWVVGPDGPLTTGRFLRPDDADSDGAGPTAGSRAAPPFPGQDFVNPPVNLVGFMTVITIEPAEGDSPEPFFLKLLVAESIPDTGPGVPLQPMENTAAEFPSGTATRP
jgi:hypothetical protein